MNNLKSACVQNSERYWPQSFGVVAGAALFASLFLLPTARGELVVGSTSDAPAAVATEQYSAIQDEGSQPQFEDRESTREALTVSDKVRVTQQSVQPVQPVLIQQPPVLPVQYIQVAPPQQIAQESVAVTSAASVGPESFSRTELMRERRAREEVKNEDTLQERLEELRLIDEKKRAEQVLGLVPGAPAPVAIQAPAAPALVEQQVVVPVTERPGQVVEPMLVASASPLVMGSSSVTAFSGDDSDQAIVYIQPRGGLSNINQSEAYQVEGRYSAGVGLGVSVSDNLSFELGYDYHEYAVALNSATAMGLGAYLNPYGISSPNQANRTGALKQNTVEAGLKLHFLGPNARLRPFIGGGAAYSKSFLNYDQRILNLMRNTYSPSLQDYEVSQFLGQASAGFDVRLSRSVSVGAVFKYYTVLNSRQNQDLNNQALYGYSPAASAYGVYGSPYTSISDADKQFVGGSLAELSFYSVLGGVTFTF